MNELFAGEGLTDSDRLNYLHTIKDKVMEDDAVASQVANNEPDQVMHGDFPDAVKNAIKDSLETHTGLASELLKDGDLSAAFSRLLLDVILQERAAP